MDGKLQFIYMIVCRSCVKTVQSMEALLATGQHAFEHDGTIIAYYIRGRGPPCFVPPYPWGLNSEPIRSFLRPLETHVTMIYHDPPGTGRSGPPLTEKDLGMERVVSDLFALQTRLGLDDAIFLGHSGGSACALTYALRYPERVSSLVLIGSGARLPDYGKVRGVGEALADSLRERNESNFRRFLAAFLGPEIRTRRGKMAMGKAMKHSIQFSIDRAAYNFVEMIRWDVRDKIRSLSIRTLIIAGKQDEATPVTLSRELHKGIKGSRIVVFDRCGHFPFLDEPERFRKAVVEFLDMG